MFDEEEDVGLENPDQVAALDEASPESEPAAVAEVPTTPETVSAAPAALTAAATPDRSDQGVVQEKVPDFTGRGWVDPTSTRDAAAVSSAQASRAAFEAEANREYSVAGFANARDYMDSRGGGQGGWLGEIDNLSRGGSFHGQGWQPGVGWSQNAAPLGGTPMQAARGGPAAPAGAGAAGRGLFSDPNWAPTPRQPGDLVTSAAPLPFGYFDRGRASGAAFGQPGMGRSADAGLPGSAFAGYAPNGRALDPNSPAGRMAMSASAFGAPGQPGAFSPGAAPIASGPAFAARGSAPAQAAGGGWQPAGGVPPGLTATPSRPSVSTGAGPTSLVAGQGNQVIDNPGRGYPSAAPAAARTSAGADMEEGGLAGYAGPNVQQLGTTDVSLGGPAPAAQAGPPAPDPYDAYYDPETGRYYSR